MLNPQRLTVDEFNLMPRSIGGDSVDGDGHVRCIVESRPKVTVADVQVAQTFDVFVVVNAVVSCLAIFEAIGGRHLFNRAVSGISVCAINRVTVKRNADDFR